MPGDSTKTNLIGLTRTELEAFFAGMGEKAYRANQVMQWIHRHGVERFDEMTNLGKGLRARLDELAEVSLPDVVSEYHSADGTRKWLLQLDRGNCVETVFIPEEGRGTLCVSSQIGCALDCSFCATGKQGFNRNLTAGEIIAQLRVAARVLNHAPADHRVITNVVLMGMGEPLLNFDNVVKALDVMVDDFAYGLSKRRVTVSTAGVVPALRRLREVTDVALAVSLHAPNDELRNELVPLNRKYPIKKLLQACRDYVRGRGMRITFEYVMLDGVNDSAAHARELAGLLRDVPAKVNLIPFNPFAGEPYARSTEETIDRFRDILIRSGVVTITRRPRGEDIRAACGQLAGQVADRTKRREKRAQPAAELTRMLHQPATGRAPTG